MRSNYLILIFLLIISSSFAQGWESLGPQIPGKNIGVFSFVDNDSFLLFGTTWGCQNAHRSDNYGDNWEYAGEGLQFESSVVYSMAMQDSRILGGHTNGLFYTTNNGDSWVKFNSINESIYSLLVSGSTVIAGSLYGAYLSTDGGNNWKKYSDPTKQIAYIYSLTLVDTTILAGTSNGVRRFNKYATPNWETTSGIPDLVGIRSLGAGGGYVFAGSSEKGIYRSSDNGQNWEPKNNGLFIDKTTIFSSFEFKGSNIYMSATGPNGGVYESVDHGESWTNISTGLPAGTKVGALIIKEPYLFAGSQGSGVYRIPLSELTQTNNVIDYAALKVYPNPNNGIFTISFKSAKSKAVELNITNIYGESIFHKQYNLLDGYLDEAIDISLNSPSTYNISVRDNKNVYNSRVIVIK